MKREYVVGFDCRSMIDSEYQTSWDKAIQSSPFGPFGKRLSADNGTWNSIFNDTDVWLTLHRTADPNPIILSAHNYETGEGHWNDLDAMMQVVDLHRAGIARGAWVIAITVVSCDRVEKQLAMTSGELLQSKGHSVPRPVPFYDDAVQPDWALLGYDVQNGSPEMSQGLGPISSDAEFMNELLRRWGPSLNQYQLFLNAEVAFKFAQEMDHLLPVVAPYFVYGLYKIAELPS